MYIVQGGEEESKKVAENKVIKTKVKFTVQTSTEMGFSYKEKGMSTCLFSDNCELCRAWNGASVPGSPG